MKTTKPIKRTKPMSRGASALQRSAFKRSIPKKRQGHDKSMLNACRGEPCYLRIPGVCRGVCEKDTVVPCHSNEARHGKGLGLKARDEFTVPGCWRCHFEIDAGTRFSGPQKVALWRAAFDRWLPVRSAKLAAAKKINPASAATDPGLVIALT